MMKMMMKKKMMMVIIITIIIKKSSDAAPDRNMRVLSTSHIHDAICFRQQFQDDVIA